MPMALVMRELTSGLVDLDAMALVPPDALAVFCVGSVAHGWDNKRSDVDLVVVTARPWAVTRSRSIAVALQPRSIQTTSTELGTRKWEIKYWMDSQVDQMLAKVSHARFESGRTRSRTLVAAEESFLERLPASVLLRGDGWIRRRREQLHRSAFRAFVVSRSLAAADSSIDDALGQLDGGDLASAVLSGRKAFGHTIDALLESHSVYGSQDPKWRARRFQAAKPPQVSYEAYWQLETMSGFDPERPVEWVERVVTFCRNLLLEVEM
ncbi:MAG: hypothetical protein V7603_783 [Micromonosporaceae bacterium]